MRTAAVVMVSLAAACGGGGGGSAPELAGMYQIDHFTESQAEPGGQPASCFGEGPVVTTASHLRLGYDDFGGFRSLIWALCESADEQSCTDEFFDYEEIDGEWVIGAATSAAYSGGGCTLFHAEGEVVAVDGGVRLELRVWDEYQTIPEDECTLNEADRLSSQDECERHVVITASPIGG